LAPWVILEHHLADDIAPNTSSLAMQQHAIGNATSLVWRQFMLRCFDRRILKDEVAPYARIGRLTACIERLPPDIWPLLNIWDWESGTAMDPQGVEYYAIHAEEIQTAPDRSSRSRKKDTQREARAFFSERVKGWNRDGPFPTFEEDHKAVMAAVGHHVSQANMRRIRKEVCQKNGYDHTNWFKRGQRPT
jgi:hypothetical protein